MTEYEAIEHACRQQLDRIILEEIKLADELKEATIVAGRALDDLASRQRILDDIKQRRSEKEAELLHATICGRI